MLTSQISFTPVFSRHATRTSLQFGRNSLAYCSCSFIDHCSSLYSRFPNCAVTVITARTFVDPRRSSTSMNKTEESDVGICCYISQLPGFRAILKHRYSDFIVNEVDIDGNVLHLTCLDAPNVGKVDNREDIVDISGGDLVPQIEKFKALSGETDAEIFKTFLDQVNASSDGSVSPVVLSADSDKTHRTAVHKFFKEHFKSIVTDTIDGPDTSSKCIRIRSGHKEVSHKGRRSGKRKNRDEHFDSRGADDWPSDIGKFLRFNLYKENKSTQEALRVIGKMLGIQPKSFGFAGTKDKRSISTQGITVFKKHAWRLASLNNRLNGIKVGDFCYVPEGLFLGNLLGNRFTIILRGVVADSEHVMRSAADSLGSQGFINYFGLQRFGCGSVPTHVIGAALLKGEWRAAVDMILDPVDDDIADVLRQLPRDRGAERAILQSLKRCPGNYLQAIKSIPRAWRMLYVHSYQSYLWNHAASARLKKYGVDHVVIGDLVHCKGDQSENVLEEVHSESETYVNEDDDESFHIDEVSIADSTKEKGFQVKTINADDLAIGNYKACDIVLPLPGWRTIYPNNDIVEVYHDLAKKDGISLTTSMHNVKEFSVTSLTGGYRKVLQKPMDLEWELLTYKDRDQTLTETDLDKISMSKQCPTSTGNPLSTQNGNLEHLENVKGEEKDEGVHKALKLSFTLPASSYATMAVRELLKSSTSVAFQRTLSH